MLISRKFAIPVLLITSLGLLFLPAEGAPGLAAIQFQLGSGGQPTMTGNRGGSVVASSTILNVLLVTVNFGELSPLNTNNIVKVVVPVAIRSTVAYQVQAAVTGFASGDANSVQLSDIGFGIQNLQVLGTGRVCGVPSVIHNPFNNDPSTSVNLTGRASYPSSLASVGASAVILNGPRLSNNSISPGQPNRQDGWLFDAVFAIAPSFYSTGNFSLVLTLTITSGPGPTC
jgi:hypothetical protein